MVEEKEKKSKAEVEEVELTEVSTASAPAFKLPDGTVVGLEQYMVWLGNMVYHIRKNV